MKRSHRIAWELTYGPLEDGEQVLHRCDNPPCCRPDHLFKGDHAMNMADRDAKGRQSRLTTHSGELTPNHVLTAEQVVELRARYDTGGVLQRELAEEYGIAQAQVSRIVQGKRWNSDGTVPAKSYNHRKGQGKR